MKTSGNFKDVPIGYEFQIGYIKAIKTSATHGTITFANGTKEERYFYPTMWVQYNSVYPQLNRTDTRIRG